MAPRGKAVLTEAQKLRKKAADMQKRFTKKMNLLLRQAEDVEHRETLSRGVVKRNTGCIR
jgi:hypothetical protein